MLDNKPLLSESFNVSSQLMYAYEGWRTGGPNFVPQ